MSGLVKGIFDGVISAFQTQTDTTRLAAVLAADPGEIEEHLLNQRWAVLGVVHQLVSSLPQRRAMAPAGLIPTVMNSFEIYVFGAGVSAKGEFEKPRPAP
jgi:hypothetical protein